MSAIDTAASTPQEDLEGMLAEKDREIATRYEELAFLAQLATDRELQVAEIKEECAELRRKLERAEKKLKDLRANGSGVGQLDAEPGGTAQMRRGPIRRLRFAIGYLFVRLGTNGNQDFLKAYRENPAKFFGASPSAFHRFVGLLVAGRPA